MTTGSSHLASMYGDDLFELVWQNGQILVQGSSASRAQNSPSCIGYSINPSHGEAYEEDARVTKRTRLSTSNPLLGFPANQNSQQSNDQNCYHFNLQCTKSKSSSKVEDECANSRPAGKEFKPAELTFGQFPDSAPFVTPRMNPSQALSAVGGVPILNTQKQDFGSDLRTGKVNFSNFLRPATFLNSTCQGNSATQPTNTVAQARAEEIKSGKDEKPAAATSSKAPDPSVVIYSAKGSHSLTGFQKQTALTATHKANPVPFVAKCQKPPPDEHSEAVGVHKSAMRIHGSHGLHNNHSSLAAHDRAKGKPNSTNSWNEPLASSSVCSLGASNDPTCMSRKNEDTDDSTYLTDNDEELENVIEETPGREITRVKRGRNAEIHNLSERKRRDKINKKIRALKELIPNCNKMDKASMLDDAIEYLKTLKLQLQIMSVGTGLCMPIMMLPAAGAHHINTTHMPQLMGAGMGLRPGTGISCSLPQFPSPQMPGITDNRLQMLGFPSQVLPMPIPHAPYFSMLGKPAEPLLATSTATNLAGHLATSHLTTSKESILNNSDLDAEAKAATMQASNQGNKLKI